MPAERDFLATVRNLCGNNLILVSGRNATASKVTDLAVVEHSSRSSRSVPGAGRHCRYLLQYFSIFFSLSELYRDVVHGKPIPALRVLTERDEGR